MRASVGASVEASLKASGRRSIFSILGEGLLEGFQKASGRGSIYLIFLFGG